MTAEIHKSEEYTEGREDNIGKACYYFTQSTTESDYKKKK